MSAGREELPSVPETEPVVTNEAPIEIESGDDVGEPDVQPELEEGPKDESPRDTAKRVAEAIKKDKDPGREGQKQQEAKPLKQEADIEPPQRLSAVEKQVFSKLPNELKPAVARMIRDHEATFTRTMQAVQAERQEVAGIREAIRPYYVSHPELAEAGYTESGFVSALVGVHAKLMDPKTKEKALLDIVRQNGYSASQLAELESGGHITKENSGASQADISSHPQFLALQEQLQSVLEWKGAHEQHQVSQASQRIVQEIEAVRNEKDALGNYRYPRMHDADFFDRAKPLVSELVRVTPGLPYGDAFRRVYVALEGQPIGDSPQPTQARFPATNTQTAQRAAQAAGVSVRGRAAPPSNGMLTLDKIPDSARETAALVLQQLRAGR